MSGFTAFSLSFVVSEECGFLLLVEGKKSNLKASLWDLEKCDEHFSLGKRSINY